MESKRTSDGDHCAGISVHWETFHIRVREQLHDLLFVLHIPFKLKLTRQKRAQRHGFSHLDFIYL